MQAVFSIFLTLLMSGLTMFCGYVLVPAVLLKLKLQSNFFKILSIVVVVGSTLFVGYTVFNLFGAERHVEYREVKTYTVESIPETGVSYGITLKDTETGEVTPLKVYKRCLVKVTKGETIKLQIAYWKYENNKKLIPDIENFHTVFCK